MVGMHLNDDQSKECFRATDLNGKRAVSLSELKTTLFVSRGHGKRRVHVGAPSLEDEEKEVSFFLRSKENWKSYQIVSSCFQRHD